MTPEERAIIVEWAAARAALIRAAESHTPYDSPEWRAVRVREGQATLALLELAGRLA